MTTKPDNPSPPLSTPEKNTPDAIAGELADDVLDAAVPTLAESAADAEAALVANGRTAPETRVLRQFRVVFNAVKSHFRQIEKAAGIGGAQVWALSVIDARPGVGMNELARAMDVHQSTASNLVKTLVAQQMIAVEKADTDRRAVALRLLPAGAEILARVPAPFAGVLPDALATLPPESIASLDLALGQLIVALQADDRAASIPLANL